MYVVYSTHTYWKNLWKRLVFISLLLLPFPSPLASSCLAFALPAFLFFTCNKTINSTHKHLSIHTHHQKYGIHSAMYIWKLNHSERCVLVIEIGMASLHVRSDKVCVPTVNQALQRLSISSPFLLRSGTKTWQKA